MVEQSALIMALPSESKGLFEQAGIQVHYSGIGKVNAAFKAYEVIQRTGCKILFNLGTAGSSYFDTHSLVEVSSFVQRDMDVSPLGFVPGITPMDEEIPGCIELVSYFINCLKESVELVTPSKQACLKCLVIWWIWKVMPWLKFVKNLEYAWYLSNILVMVPTPQHIWIGKIICCWERINCWIYTSRQNFHFNRKEQVKGQN